jgi:hypothetical protein
LTMSRVLSAFVLSGLLALLAVITAGSARAGEYGYYRGDYDGGYDGRSYTHSNCCYRRVVEYDRVNSEDYDRPYYRNYGYGYRYGSRYGSRNGYRYGSYYGTSRYYDRRPYYGYANTYYGYDYASSYADGCYGQRVRMDDGRGGWVWGVPVNCY